jgi:hypothetical protein
LDVREVDLKVRKRLPELLLAQEVVLVRVKLLEKTPEVIKVLLIVYDLKFHLREHDSSELVTVHLLVAVLICLLHDLVDLCSARIGVLGLDGKVELGNRYPPVLVRVEEVEKLADFFFQGFLQVRVKRSQPFLEVLLNAFDAQAKLVN